MPDFEDLMDHVLPADQWKAYKAQFSLNDGRPDIRVTEELCAHRNMDVTLTARCVWCNQYIIYSPVLNRWSAPSGPESCSAPAHMHQPAAED